MHARANVVAVAFAAVCAIANLPGCGASTAADDPAVAAACARYADAIVHRVCIDEPALPSDEIDRRRPIVLRDCVAESALPGSSWKPPTIDACTHDVTACAALPCARSPGTSAVGSACAFDEQCASGWCQFMGAPAPACGVCVAPLERGWACYGDDECGPGVACAGDVCMVVTKGDVGAQCRGLALRCRAGLACVHNSTCVAVPSVVGAPCDDTVGCQYPLVCNGSACSEGAAIGQLCIGYPCVAGATCDLPMETCAALAWVRPGEECSGAKRCLVGNCYPGPAGRCPSVLATGAACDANDRTTTCDIDDVCRQGACASVYAAVCK